MKEEEIANLVRQALAEEFSELREAKGLVLSAAEVLEDCAEILQLADKPNTGPEHIKLHVMRLQKKAALIREAIRHQDRKLG